MTAHIAIFSDLRGNNAATDAVLEVIEAERPDAVCAPGDPGRGRPTGSGCLRYRDRGSILRAGGRQDGGDGVPGRASHYPSLSRCTGGREQCLRTPPITQDREQSVTPTAPDSITP